MKNKKIIFLIFLLMGFYACSTVKFGYNWADYLLYRRIDKHFDIMPSQEEFIETKLDKLHIWHRNEELPKYIYFLEEVKHRVKNGIADEDINWFYKGLRGFGKGLVNYISKDSIKFLYSLSDSQIKYFEESISERNEKKLKRIKKPYSEKRDDLLENAIEDVEEWLGDLSKEQEKIVEGFIVVNNKIEMIKYNHQLRSQQRFIKILKEKKDFDKFSEKLNAWFFNYRRFYTKEYATVVIERRKRTRAMILQIDSFATEDQRENALEKIDNYIKIMKEIQND
ncbi:MAG: hypothetical protein GY714_09905 [Desulfobacterales bacterium]|nr:hypothetical protein [Desulfobacterales bacterium]MCP4161677.1 hypothetical protein [Deltaproteobacteria bacterium]